ncbi:hypothetical protein FRACYDRAFT_235210 [Fragilariopsis cylindrus CCMP1102]|uniref:Uncharacterized protein n=1 Tax=Fragilariopsis cylindrus CCMP1102 TaxID=635003 RepID=A0A1E7FTX8_9STRA|nr:hypothetical protein FRACYDRAFT_235210 [Fragilariopsis cylindrus CCMP1102]|eukprot:OEU21584.1 hypothetical protein FRACYDRAFT_235210 [Fragilariopsis cylindrus CCMP1102]
MVLIVKQVFLSVALLLLVQVVAASSVVVADGATTATSNLRGGKNKKRFLRAQRIELGPTLYDWKVKCIKPSGCYSGAGDMCLWCLKALATTSATENSSGVKHCADSMCGNCSAENIRPFFSCGLQLEYPERYYYSITDATVIDGIDVEINKVSIGEGDITEGRAETTTTTATTTTTTTDTGIANADPTTDTINCPSMFPGSGNDCVMINGYSFKECRYGGMVPSVCQCSIAQPIWSCAGVIINDEEVDDDEEREELIFVVDEESDIEIDDNPTIIDDFPVFEIDKEGGMVVGDTPVTQPVPVEEEEIVVVETPVTQPAPVEVMDEVVVVENPATQPTPVEEEEEVAAVETPDVVIPVVEEKELDKGTTTSVIVNPFPETCPLDMPRSSGKGATKCNMPSNEICCYSIQPSFAVVCNCDNKSGKFNCVIGVQNDCPADNQNPSIVIQPPPPPPPPLQPIGTDKAIVAVEELTAEEDTTTVEIVDQSVTSGIQQQQQQQQNNARLCPFEQPKQGLECSTGQLNDISCCYGNTSCVCSLSSYTQKYVFTCMSGSWSNCN